MRIENSISSLLLPCVSLAASVALAACSPTVRDFSGGGGDAGAGGSPGVTSTSSSSTSGSGGDGGEGGQGCASPLTVCDSGCTDTSVDPANCGACGNGCPAPAGALATCERSTCGYRCDGLHDDCNRQPEDGCETDITSELGNCGFCGNGCPTVRGSTTTCEGGMCGFLCDRGFADCRPDTPGCETFLLNDPGNCGGCGLPCPRGMSCFDGSCRPGGLTGATGDVWEAVPVNATGNHGLQDFVPRGQPHMYVASQSDFDRYTIATSTWERLAPAPVAFPFWGSPAPAGGFIWGIRADRVIRYDPSTNVWATVRSDLHGGDEQCMTIADDIGHLWGFNSAKELVEYDPFADTVRYHPTGIMGDTFETRLGFDRVANSIFFAGFQQPVMNRYALASGGISTTAPHPEGSLNDIFCADRSGHIYAAGGSTGNTIWQYDTAADSWRRIPDFPVDHGNNGSCSVHEDGWLYVETGTTSANVFRLRLL
jgi:hypothetical protein